MQRTTASLTALPLLLVAAACASAPGASHGPSAPAPSADAPSLRALYDDGFARIVDALPQPSPGEATPLAQLRILAAFRRDQVRWATLRGIAYEALEPGGTSGAWLVIVPPGNPVLERMRGFIEENLGAARVLEIRPERVSEVWAGLLLVHHLSHLWDWMSGTLGPGSSRTQVRQGEIRVYWRMLAAADLLTRGAFRAGLDSLLDRWGPHSLAELGERALNIEFSQVSALNATLPPGAGVSRSELVDRAAFFAAALVMRFAESHAVATSDLESALDRLAVAGQHR